MIAITSRDLANPLLDLVNAPPEEQERRGIRHTPGEIWRQPDLWPGTIARAAALLEGAEDGLCRALADERTRIVLTGAGSSHFVGDCLAPAIGRATGRMAVSLESTEIVAHPTLLHGPGPLILVSFARSGDSPESMGVYRLAARVRPAPLQVVVTCNEHGALAVAARADGHPCLALDPLTNDQGLAMTASFTNLLVAGLGLAHLGRWRDYRAVSTTLRDAGRCLLRDFPAIAAAALEDGCQRAVFLGSGGMLGVAREAGLKVLEMTAGRVPSMAQSFLGLRHGPLSFITKETLVVALRGADQYERRYEADLLTQLVGKGFAPRMLVFDPRVSADGAWAFRIGLPSDLDLPMACCLPAAGIVGQVLALLLSLKHGCRPDEPSPTGLIHRVVEGVTLYDLEWPGPSA